MGDLDTSGDKLDMNKNLINKQIEYYNKRAAEYDEWFYRLNRYDKGKESNDKWFNEVKILKKNLYSLTGVHSILEFAPGTGIWTKELALIGDEITAVDSSEEMINLNKEKNKFIQDRIRYENCNIFEWKSVKTYDLIFFSFWLSHVPPAELKGFIDTLYKALQSDGTVFIIDSLKSSISTAKNHTLKDNSIVQQRRLNNGETFTIYKIFYDAKELEKIFEKRGFKIKLKITGEFFWYGKAWKDQGVC